MSIRFLAPEVCSRLRSGIATPTVEQCVEELVLNSIDAGATCVAIRADIANYKIQVIDNGFGLSKDGMDIIGERYATSKCHDLKDLDNLSFFGYRGEALASIGQISGVLEIVSRTKDSDVTYSKLFKNGMPSKAFESNKRRPSPGTTIIVHSIFQNLPVRRKMLSPSLDYERVRKRIQGLALIKPEVSITLRDDNTGSVSIQTHCTSSIVSTFGCLFGQEHCKLLKEVKHGNDTFIVHGFIGVEGHFTKKLQFVYVNKRIVLKTKLHRLTNLLLGRSLIAKRKIRSEGKDIPQSKDVSYSDLSSPGRLQDLYAMYVLNIDCALSEYDISLDPGKTLVEFKNWCGVLRCLEELILDFLHRENLTMKLDKPSPELIVKEMDYSEIGNDDSQDDVTEGTCLSEDASDRIADLLERYGRGICTSSCSNTLQGLTVRRRTVQKSSPGHSDMSDELEDQDCAKTSNSKQTIEQDRIENDTPQYIAKCSANNRERSPQLECNTQIEIPTSNMMETETPASLREILTIPDSDETGVREMSDTRIVTSLLDMQTSEVSATPSTVSLCEDRINAVPDFISSCTNCNSSTIQLDGTGITDAIQSNGLQLSAITGTDSVAAPKPLQTPDTNTIDSVQNSSPLEISQNKAQCGKPESTTADKMELIEIITDKDVIPVETDDQGNKTSSKESYCTLDFKSITSTHARASEGNNPRVTSKVKESPDETYPRQYYNKEIRNEKRKTSAVLYETCKKVMKSSVTKMDQTPLNLPIACNISDTITLKEKQTDKGTGKCFDANSRSSENMFLQTPVLHQVAGAITQELNCRRVAECQNDLKNENYKTTPIGPCPLVTNRKIGLLRTLSALGSFRYQKATESSLKILNSCTSANNKELLRGQCSSIEKQSHQYESSLHVFKQSVKPRCTVVEQNLQTVGNKSECSSPMLLLLKEHSIPQLGNAALRKNSCTSCTTPVAIVSNQKKQVLRNIVSEQLQDYIGSRPSSEHLEQNVGKRILCSAPQPTDNSKCKIKPSVTFQTEGQFMQSCSNKRADKEHLRNDVSINRIDATTRTASVHKSTSQKPNLKRLRNHFSLEYENMSEKHSKEDDSSSQKKVFLTSESFLVSAQDLLHGASAISTCSYKTHNSNSRHSQAVDGNDKRGTCIISDNIWSMIEADCRKTNKTCATETDSTHATDSLHIENTNWAPKQISSRICADKLSGESIQKESDIYLVDNQSEYFERHNMTHVEYSSKKNEPSLNTDVRAEGSVHASKNLATVDSTRYQTLNLSVNSVENEDECDKRRQSHGNFIDIVTDTQVDVKDTTISQTMHPVGDIEQIKDHNNIIKLVDMPSDTTEVTTMHPVGDIEQIIDRNNISKLVDTPFDTNTVTTMHPVGDIEQINDHNNISKLVDTLSDPNKVTTMHPVEDIEQIIDRNNISKLVDTPSDTNTVTTMHPVGDIEQINDHNNISKLVDTLSDPNKVTTMHPVEDIEQISDQNNISNLVDTPSDTNTVTTMLPVGDIEQINDQNNISKLVDTLSDTTKVTTMHPVEDIEQISDQNNISNLVDTPSDTFRCLTCPKTVTTMHPVGDIEQISGQNNISNLVDTPSDTFRYLTCPKTVTTMHPVGDIEQINGQNNISKLVDTPFDTTIATTMHPVRDTEQINDHNISKLVDPLSDKTEVTTMHPVEDIEQISGQNNISKLVDTPFDTTIATTMHPVRDTEQIHDHNISKLVDTPSDTTTGFKYMVESDCHASVSPVQSTQSFTSNSRNILIEAATPDQESRNDVQIDHDKNEGNVIETPDEIGLETESSEVRIDKESYKMLNSVDREWVAHYDSKKGQLVYVNRQSGNCCLRMPNEEDGKQEGDKGRKDFKDGASTSSSVSVFMRNAGQVHPHLSHNATPFLPRNKQHRLGVCNQHSGGPEEAMARPSNVVVSLVDKHLENEDQDIASKWRDGTEGADANNMGGGSFQQLLSEGTTPTYSTMETSIFDIRCSQLSANAVRIHGALHPYKFTKEMFQNMKVIGQVDNKFIACMVNTEETVSPTDANLLILVDQHAAHERVRLEQLTADAYEEETSGNESDGDDSEDPLPIIKTSRVIPTVQLALSAEDVRLIKVFKPKLQRLGIGIHLPDDTSSGDVEITHLPACMVEREAQELRRGRKPVALTMVESLIRSLLDSLQDTSGACAVLPKTITKLLNSQACHGAIKFGDQLADHEILTLIGQLSRCDLPFQCAHGRPSLIPVVDIKLLASKLQTSETDVHKPRIWKLKKGLCIDEG